MSKFVELLDWLIKEEGLNQKIFAEKAGISESCISQYLADKHIPTVENLVKIADYFHCSTDFLLGKEEEQENLTFKECPPFSERIKFLKNEFGGTPKKFIENAKIVRASYFNWASGKRVPSLDNIMCLAKNLDRRVDYILGRES